MYHSVLLVNVGADPNRLRPGRLWVRNLYRIHQRLCMAFPDDPRRRHDPAFLQRIGKDEEGGGLGALGRIAPLQWR